jgi:hypothetical protein
MSLVCFSHLRWNFVYQRPQHLLSRFTKKNDVFYVEECIYNDSEDGYSVVFSQENVCVVTPHLKNNVIDKSQENDRLKVILNGFFSRYQITDYIFWYYTPMPLAYTKHFKPQITIYDCMDELSNFKFAPPELKQLENDLLQKAELVFTGGNSLYESKKKQHTNIHPFPSSIDKEHFKVARGNLKEFADQKN